jgi:hypothetical protein
MPRFPDERRIDLVLSSDAEFIYLKCDFSRDVDIEEMYLTMDSRQIA